MDHCEKCAKNTLSRPSPLKKAMVCTVCGTAKGPLPTPSFMNVKDIVTPPCEAIINVSTDEWVMMEKTSKAWLYTEGLIGCVGLVVESADRFAMSHVLDRNHPTTSDQAATKHALNLISAVLGRSNIQSVGLVITAMDAFPATPTLKLVQEWVSQCGADDRNVDTFTGSNCVMVCPTEGDRSVQPGRKITLEERRLLKNPAKGVRWITNWGKLPQWVGHTED